MCLQCLPFLTRFHPSPLSPRRSHPALSPLPPDTHVSAASASVADAYAASEIPPLEAEPPLQPTDSTLESSEACSSAISQEPEPPIQASYAIQAFPVQEPESTVKPSYTPQLVSQEDDYNLEPSKIPEALKPNVSPDQIKSHISLTEPPALSLQQDPFELSNESSCFSTYATEDPAEQPTEQDCPELSYETSSESSSSPQEWSCNALSLPNENVEDEPVIEEEPASEQAEKYPLYVKFPASKLKPLLMRPGKEAKQQEHQHHHRITKHLHELRKQVKEGGQRHLQNLFTGTKNQEP